MLLIDYKYGCENCPVCANQNEKWYDIKKINKKNNNNSRNNMNTKSRETGPGCLIKRTSQSNE